MSDLFATKEAPMSSQDINEMLTCVSQIMHQIEQGDLSETEIQVVVSLLSGLAKPESRADILRSFTRTIKTVPPQPPVTEPPEAGPFVIESEKEPTGNKEPEETKAISVPANPRFAANIGVKPKTNTAYTFVRERTSRELRDEGLPPTRLDEETTKGRRIIDVRSFRDPKNRK
jgi:hypothetical protein